MSLYYHHTKSKGSIFKIVEVKMQEKEDTEQNVLDRCCKQVMNGCLDAYVCVLLLFCVGSRQTYHMW